MSVPATNKQRKVSGVVVPHQLPWHGRLAALLIYALIRTVAASVRFVWHDRSGQFESPPHSPIIYCIWHNRLALCLQLFHYYVRRRQPGRSLAALVSASKDGGLLARVLELFGVQSVRGSTSRRGPQALLELTTWAERGFDLAITPDGPRGPRYVVQEGAIMLAQLTGLPIVPVSYHLSWKTALKSWDAFQIPLPGTRCEVTLDEIVHVPRDATEEQREQLRQLLESRLRAITRD